MKELLEAIRAAAKQALSDCADSKLLETLRVQYLGKKGELTGILKQMGKLSAEERPAMGQLANQVRADIENALAEKLKKITVTIKASCGGDGRLYGSVTAKDVAERLASEHGITLDKRKIVVKDPIKAYGRYALEVKLYPEVTGTLTLAVVAEQ